MGPRLSRPGLCGHGAAPLPRRPAAGPLRGFLSSRTIPGRVIAGDLPSELLTRRRGRPHLRSLSPEPHRPRSPGALGGQQGGLLPDLGGAAWVSLLRKAWQGRAGSLSGLGTVTRMRLAHARAWPRWPWRGPGDGSSAQGWVGPKLAAGGWSPPPKHPHLPPREWGRGEKKGSHTAGDSKCRQNYHSQNREL